MSGTLSLVSTPIGNLNDVTLRAIATLSAADIIACEDTRVTRKLLDAHGISGKRLVSIHQHSSDRSLDDLLDEANTGKRIAYASDAGTPGVNDPGGKLVARAFAREIAIEVIPGASALTAAIAACGFPMEHFVNAGFIPIKKHRAATLRAISEREESTVFFESTHRIMKTLDELTGVLDAKRPIYIGRELTKLHETHYRGSIADVIAALRRTSTKGELVIVIGPERYCVSSRKP